MAGPDTFYRSCKILLKPRFSERTLIIRINTYFNVSYRVEIIVWCNVKIIILDAKCILSFFERDGAPLAKSRLLLLFLTYTIHYFDI